jgi:threonine dehydrogenase-like Zn-dependent dehydrogenase
VRIEGHQVAVVDVPDPEGEGVVAEVLSSSICGTDLSLVAAGAAGFTLGHEFVVAVDGVPYAVEPTVWCRACEECRAGHTQRCTGEHGNLGVFTDGGLADRVLVRRQALVALPEGLGPAEACLVEPAAVAWHGVARATVEPGERVVVVGGGSIGLLAVAALRDLGHDVDLEARHPGQRQAGEHLGAGTPDGLYDVVIEAAGSASGLARCAELARPGARVVLIGVFWDTVPVPGPASLIKELTVIAAMAYGRSGGTREVDQAAALLAGHPEVAETLITHRFGLDEAPRAFAVAGDRAAGAIKVVLAP